MDSETAADQKKLAALGRLRGCDADAAREHAFFIGPTVAGLAGRYCRVACTVYSAPGLKDGRALLAETFPARGKSPKILLVVGLGPADHAAEFAALRQLVEPLDGLLGADPRTVLVGEAMLDDYGSVRSLLWSHVVDWFPATMAEESARERLDRAWRRNSFRRRLLGLGLVSGAPVHVVTHHRTRLQLARDLRLDHLTSEPFFRAAMQVGDGPVQWDSFAEDLYWYLRSSLQDDAERWAAPFGLTLQQLGALKSSGLRDREDRSLLLRFWCLLLVECLDGALDMTRKDLAELEGYVDDSERDFLKGADNE
jgi:hypothetical protein